MCPFIHIFSLQIPMYGVCMTVAFFLVAFIAIKKAKDVPYENIVVIAAMTLGAALLGGKLLYLIVSYSPKEIISYIKDGDMSFLFDGGLVFYGGLFFGIGGAYLGGVISQTKLSELEGAIVPYVPLGHAIGRIGCFCAGCCRGVEYSGFPAVHYKQSLYGLHPDVGYFPVQLLEAFLDLVIMMILIKESEKQFKKYTLLIKYLFLYSVMRFATEFLRGDSVRGYILWLSTSQWISLALCVFCVMSWMIIQARCKDRY